VKQAMAAVLLRRGETDSALAQMRAPAGKSPRRYRDTRFEAIAVKVFPGEHYVTQNPEEMLVTVLGSCVSACVRDPVARVGGMNHFMLPSSPGDGGEWGQATTSLRYGNFAMEHLINDILKLGGLRGRLEVKIFGGGRMLNLGAAIGDRNVEFVEAYLKAEHLPIAARHTLGSLARRVHYFPITGKVLMQEIGQAQEDPSLVEAETHYRTELAAEQASGSIELFD